MFDNREIWHRHLSASLKANHQVAYVWQVENDQFEFTGDSQNLFGVAEADMPTSKERFFTFINPQDVVERQLLLSGYISECVSDPVDFKLHYRVRKSDGQQTAIVETGTVSINPSSALKEVSAILSVDQDVVRKQATLLDGKNVSFALMPNAPRRDIQYLIEEHLERGHRKEGFLLAIGIDHFSVLNEAYGPKFADEILTRTEKRLQKVASDAVRVVRLHGDLFGMFFSRGGQLEMSETAYGILKSFYSQPFEVNGQTINNMVSIGGVALDTPDIRISNILNHAEMALREAKNRGRGCFVSYSGNLSGDKNGFKDYLAIGDQFLKAYRDGRVHLAYQKIVNSQTDQVTFHECLIRMVDEQGKVQSAGQFIDAVEKMGMTRLVDNFSTRRAIQELRIFPELSLSVNVSHHSLTDPQWLREVENDLGRSPEVARRLIIEITESFAMIDVAQTLRVIKTLRDLGCQIALDDFGAGQTSFTQLRDLRVDMVKIDKSFVRNMRQDDNMLFINVLQSLAGGMDIETVGEGAETLAEAKILANGGINHIQGYAFSVPSMERIWLPEENEFRMPDLGKLN